MIGCNAIARLRLVQPRPTYLVLERITQIVVSLGIVRLLVLLLLKLVWLLLIYPVG